MSFFVQPFLLCCFQNLRLAVIIAKFVTLVQRSIAFSQKLVILRTSTICEKESQKIKHLLATVDKHFYNVLARLSRIVRDWNGSVTSFNADPDGVANAIQEFYENVEKVCLLSFWLSKRRIEQTMLAQSYLRSCTILPKGEFFFTASIFNTIGVKESSKHFSAKFAPLFVSSSLLIKSESELFLHIGSKRFWE